MKRMVLIGVGILALTAGTYTQAPAGNLEAALAAHPGAPDEWRRYVQQVVAVNRAALGTPVDEALAVHAWRGIRQLGAIGSGWVEAWQAAHEGGADRILERIAP